MILSDRKITLLFVVSSYLFQPYINTQILKIENESSFSIYQNIKLKGRINLSSISIPENISLNIVDYSSLNGILVLFDPKTGDFIYQPDQNFTGNASFKLALIEENTNTVITDDCTIEVKKIPNSYKINIAKNNVYTNRLEGFGQSPYFFVCTSPTHHGTIMLINPNTGEYCYSPNKDFIGTDTFFYQVVSSDEKSIIRDFEMIIQVSETINLETISNLANQAIEGEINFSEVSTLCDDLTEKFSEEEYNHITHQIINDDTEHTLKSNVDTIPLELNSSENLIVNTAIETIEKLIEEEKEEYSYITQINEDIEHTLNLNVDTIPLELDSSENSTVNTAIKTIEESTNLSDDTLSTDLSEDKNSNKEEEKEEYSYITQINENIKPVPKSNIKTVPLEFNIPKNSILKNQSLSKAIRPHSKAKHYTYRLIASSQKEGSVHLKENGDFIFTSSFGSNGPGMFEYTVEDNQGSIARGRVTILVFSKKVVHERFKYQILMIYNRELIETYIKLCLKSC